MSLKFNIDRPKASDEEIEKQKNFKELVERFKQQSLKKAQGDESWWKNKRIRYATVIAGVTVVCTITYSALKTKNTTTKHETLTTQKSQELKTEKKPFVSAPSTKLAIPYKHYKVNNAQGAKIVHAGATKITVPKNSFVDKNGRDIVGEVSIAYREFHDVGDIIAGGIPMAYDSAGHRYNLESAGMFDITGTQHGKPVYIKKNQSITVELASRQPEDRFNQYYLDTAARNWQYLKRDNPVVAGPIISTRAASPAPAAPENETTRRLQHEITQVIPRKIDSVKTLYDRKVAKLVSPKIPSKPKEATKNRPSFKIDGSTEEFPELSAFQNLLFEVGPENKNYRPEMHEITWSDIHIGQGPDKGTNYLLTLSHRNRQEKLIVYPVLQGSDYDKALSTFEQKLELYNSLVEKKQREEQRLIAEMETKQAAFLAEQRQKEEQLKKERAKLQLKSEMKEQAELASNFNNLDNKTKTSRLFSVSRFGIYNSDCPQPDIGTKSILPVFSDHKNNKVFPEVVYLVDHSRKTVYVTQREQAFKFSYHNDLNYSLCVFARNKLYLCNKTAFKESTSGGGSTFVVTALSEDADNLMDFKKALEI